MQMVGGERVMGDLRSGRGNGIIERLFAKSKLNECIIEISGRVELCMKLPGSE